MVILALTACQPGPEQLAEDMNLTRYLGQASVSEVRPTPELGQSTTYTFEVGSGPSCMRGDPFQMATRDREGSNDVVVFLQGGGACWDEFCLAVVKAPDGIPDVDILRTDLSNNPVADWNVVYLPYCDGSLFAGDLDVDEDGDGEADRYQRGLANLSAALDIAREAYPSPDRVLLTGSSGGALGAMLNMPLVRHVWPDAELMVMTDSGAGVARGQQELGFVTGLAEAFNAEGYLPPECLDCFDEGHMAPFVDWYLEHDAGVRYGMFSSWYDTIIGDMFMDVPASQFRDDLAGETGRTHARFPDRYRRFIVDGGMHTTLLGNPIGIIGDDLSSLEFPLDIFSALSNLSLGSLETTQTQAGDRFDAWLQGLVEADSDSWQDLQDEAGEAPVWESSNADED